MKFVGGIYRDTLPTYTDGQNAIFHFTADGKLLVDTEVDVDIRDLNYLQDSVSVYGSEGQPLQQKATTNDLIITLDGEDVTTVPGPIQGRTFKYEDTSFLTGESPRVLDINTDLGRNSVDGYLINDGAGNILVEFSNNSTDYGGQHTIKKGEVIDLRNLDIDSIRLTWVSDSSYRILVL